jgi:hypothetical protein
MGVKNFETSFILSELSHKTRNWILWCPLLHKRINPKLLSYFLTSFIKTTILPLHAFPYFTSCQELDQLLCFPACGHNRLVKTFFVSFASRLVLATQYGPSVSKKMHVACSDTCNLGRYIVEVCNKLNIFIQDVAVIGARNNYYLLYVWALKSFVGVWCSIGTSSAHLIEFSQVCIMNSVFKYPTIIS